MREQISQWFNALGLTRKRILCVHGNIIVAYLFEPNHGNGRGIVYCHGGFGAIPSAEKVWIRHMRHLGYIVLALQYPGEGLSPGKDKPEATKDFQEVADSTYWLREQYGVSSIDLVGVSRGGWVALHSFTRSTTYFHSCFVSVAPTSLPEFFKETSLPTPVQLELREYFGNRSPITHAREIAQTGKLIGLLYDRDDQIVPENQGVMMHNALGAEGGNVKSHVSEGYGHGMILYPKNQKVLVKWLLERE